MKKDLPVRKTMCPTCPFREGSPNEYLRDDLQRSACSEASRICHSTGSNAINHRTGKPEMLCRGARNQQEQFLHRLGFLPEATDAAWEAKRKELNV